MIDGDYEIDPRCTRDASEMHPRRVDVHVATFEARFWDWLSPTDDEGTEGELCCSAGGSLAQ